jgi:hypothetical protein
MFAAIRTQTSNRPQRSATCRREGSREKFRPASITAWSAYDAPVRVAAIEADCKGARLMLPWPVQTGERICVSLGNEVGLFETRNARVVWTQTLQVTGKVVAGVAFDSEAHLAVAV